MSLFLPLRRATLLVPSGPDNDPDRKHLFVLLTDPVDDATGVKSVLMVSLFSIKKGLLTMRLAFSLRAITPS